MRQELIAALLLYLALPDIVCAMDSAYQWTDKQGQIHYGDKPSASVDSRTITLQRRVKRADNPSGLRRGELDQLSKLEQRQQQQKHRAEAAKAQSDRQRAARRLRCAKNRAMLKNSRGNENFKKHARYLRNNCW